MKKLLVLSILILFSNTLLCEQWFSDEDNEILKDIVSNHLRELAREVPGTLRSDVLKISKRLKFSFSQKTEVRYNPDNDTYYLTITEADYYNPNLNSILRHELYHLLHYKRKGILQAWELEGLAQYYEYKKYGTFPHDKVYAFYGTNPQDYFSNETLINYRKAFYGHAFLLFNYFDRRCDGKILWKYLESDLQLLPFLEAECESFMDLYVDFRQALKVNSVKLLNGNWDDKELISESLPLFKFELDLPQSVD